MDNNFELPITYKGQEYIFPATLITYGYSYKITVVVFTINVDFEPDEERNFRAVIALEELQRNKIDLSLLQEIAAALEAAFK